LQTCVSPSSLSLHATNTQAWVLGLSGEWITGDTKRSKECAAV
jgi:hypothetical protein